jgi:hypothetical protein
VNPEQYVFFSFSFANSGILKTAMSEQETRDKLNRELAAIYGPEGLTITEFRPATDEEVAEMQNAFNRVSEDTPTIN